MNTPLNTARDRRIDAVAIGASAGGVSALLDLLSGLPGSFCLPMVIVLHLPEGRQSRLTQIFQHRLAMTVREATDKDAIAPATVYFAPPGYHLLLETDHTFSLSCEPPVNFSRPSIDLLMASAADAYGARLAGIVLTGANADGAVGLAKIGQQGGLTVVQDPAEAEIAIMPEAAIRLARPDLILDLKGIRSLLLEMEQLHAER